MRLNYAATVGGLVVAATALAGVPSARAQSYAPPVGGGAAYLPYAGVGGGFVPYGYGPGAAGGLGVQPGASRPAIRFLPENPPEPAMRRELGALGTLLPPPPMSLGAGMGGGLIRRPGFGAMPGAVVRPPVGGYPFRAPTAFGASAASPMGGM